MASPIYSIVVPVFDEAANLPELYRRMRAVMEGLGEPWELVFVNDGSADDLPAIMRNMRSADERVRVVSFARNFGHQIAVTAGLDVAEGQAVIVIDADLQDPPEVIPGAHCAMEGGLPGGLRRAPGPRGREPGSRWPPPRSSTA